MYEKADRDLNRGEGDPLDPYSRLLWLAGKLMLTAYSAKRLDALCPNFSEWCAEIERRTRRYALESPGASADAIQIEVGMLRHIERGTLNDEEAGKLIEQMRQILTRGASRRQLASMVDYAELLRFMTEGATHKQKTFRPQAPILARITAALREWQGES